LLCHSVEFSRSVFHLPVGHIFTSVDVGDEPAGATEATPTGLVALLPLYLQARAASTDIGGPPFHRCSASPVAPLHRIGATFDPKVAAC
jgi:hypothetical protein